MKFKSLMLISCCFFLSSCLVKSIRPFYISKSIKHQEFLVGNWKDHNDNTWNVASFEALMNENNKENPDLNSEEKNIFEKYKQGYIMTYKKADKKSEFVAIPFLIGNQLFLDFIPFDFEEVNNDLVNQHLLKTHSVAKVDKNSNNSIKITWLDEARIKELLKQDQLKLKHEKIGLDESFVLTASSEELYRFLKKYNASSVENKWKSSEKFTLTKINAQP